MLGTGAKSTHHTTTTHPSLNPPLPLRKHTAGKRRSDGVPYLTKPVLAERGRGVPLGMSSMQPQLPHLQVMQLFGLPTLIARLSGTRCPVSKGNHCSIPSSPLPLQTADCARHQIAQLVRICGSISHFQNMVGLLSEHPPPSAPPCPPPLPPGDGCHMTVPLKPLRDGTVTIT